MEKVYERINWENYPSEETPVNENNLNKIDEALYEVDNRVLGLDTVKLDKSTANTMVKDVSFNESTGIFTITLLDGTTKTIDTKLEKIATNFRYDYESQKLILTLVDGTVQEVDLSKLISQYEFSDGDIISFSVDSSDKVSAIVKDGSITENKLQPNFLADVKVESAKAKSSADSSYENATIASKMAQDAKTYRDEAEQFRNEVESIANVGIATKDKAGLVKGGENAIAEDGTLLLTRTTTDRTLTESHAGGLKINRMDGESQQDGTPSPDAEAKIKSVVVSEVKAINKNLLNIADVTYTQLKTWAIKLLPGTYTVSCDIASTDTDTTQCLLELFVTPNNYSQYYKSIKFNRGKTVFTFTTTEIINSMYLWASTSSSTSYNDTVTLKNFMIVEGEYTADTIGDFEPHTEKRIALSNPITLRGIGDVKDVLCKRDGVFGVLSKMYEFTLNGTQTPNTYSGGSFGFNAFDNVIAKVTASSVKGNGLSERFIIANSDKVYAGSVDNSFAIANTEYVRLRLYSSNFTSVNDVTAFFTDNPTKFIVPLATPTFKPLPTADQIALHQLETFDTVTYISTDSEIEPIIEVEYGTSKVGAYALKGMNDIEVEKIEIKKVDTKYQPVANLDANATGRTLDATMGRTLYDYIRTNGLPIGTTGRNATGSLEWNINSFTEAIVSIGCNGNESSKYVSPRAIGGSKMECVTIPSPPHIHSVGITTIIFELNQQGVRIIRATSLGVNASGAMETAEIPTSEITISVWFKQAITYPLN